MTKEFFQRKLNELSDDKLLELLQTGKSNNQELFQLARLEAARRNFPDFDIDKSATFPNPEETEKIEDLTLLDKWNWGAFLLSPFWTLANKLEKWTLLLFIPVANIFIIFYLGRKGNRLAYQKSEGVSVDDFMTIQRHWSKWAIWLFWTSTGISVLLFLISALGR